MIAASHSKIFSRLTSNIERLTPVFATPSRSIRMISNKLLDMCRFTCCLFRVTDVQHPRRAPGSFFALPPAPSRLAPNSHVTISFAHPYPLTLLESHRFNNIPPRALPQLSFPPPPKPTPLSPFSSHSLPQ